jgi:16S rRNA (guanine527-N7)-methyltransferase
LNKVNRKEPEPPKPPPGSFDEERSRARFVEWFPDLSSEQVGSLITYLGELNKFNKAVNLVSPQTLPLADAVHFADAVYAFQLIKKELRGGVPLYDFGSGNGIPGLIMGLLDPALKVILVDRDERKLEFCKHVIATTKASNITTMKAEIDNLPRHSVVNAVARGFAPLPRALLAARNIVAKRGKFFHLKGDQFAQELSAVPSQLFSFWQPRLLGEYRLPDKGADMSVLVTDKIAE